MKAAYKTTYLVAVGLVCLVLAVLSESSVPFYIHGLGLWLAYYAGLFYGVLAGYGITVFCTGSADVSEFLEIDFVSVSLSLTMFIIPFTTLYLSFSDGSLAGLLFTLGALLQMIWVVKGITQRVLREKHNS